MKTKLSFNCVLASVLLFFALIFLSLARATPVSKQGNTETTQLRHELDSSIMPVPIPVCLFGCSMIGLAGVARYKRVSAHV